MSNFVIFRPRQKKLNYYYINLKVTSNSTKVYPYLECKGYVKYLVVLIDNRLCWKYHCGVNYIISTINKVIRSFSYLTTHFTSSREFSLLDLFQTSNFSCAKCNAKEGRKIDFTHQH